MTYLVDANVLSESTRCAPDPTVLEWLRRHERTIVVDPIVLGELQQGILILARGRKRTALEAWFDTVVKSVECVPWDRNVSMRWAKLVVQMKRAGTRLPVLDSMIAATALTHNLILVTRNVGDFTRTGVRVLNPFELVQKK